MPTPIYNFEFPRGDDHTFTLIFKNSDGNRLDITGYTIFFTLKESISDPDTEAIIEKNVTSHIDPVQGLTAVIITNAETDELKGNYYYDMQYLDTSGKILTYIKGEIQFDKDVTRRIAP